MTPKTTYHTNGGLRSEEWRNEDGRFHRLDGPAYRGWYNNGQLSREGWYKNDLLHRLDGPAYQAWNESGGLFFLEWYINDVQYDSEAEFLVAVDLYKANEIAALF